MALAVPEAAFTEFKEHCIIDCSCLSLHTRLLQTFPLFTSLEHEYTVASDIVQWCTKLKPKLVGSIRIIIWGVKLMQYKYNNNYVFIAESS